MKCPACDKEMERDDIDIGVGSMPLGQYYCPYCQYTDEPDDEGPQFGDH